MGDARRDAGVRQLLRDVANEVGCLCRQRHGCDWGTCIGCRANRLAIETDRDAAFDAEGTRLTAVLVARLTALLREDRAVCLCGCPASEHEMVDEGAEQCEHEDHECIRVAPAVLEIVGRTRLALAEATREAEGHAANVKLVQVNRDVWQTRALTAERERDEARKELEKSRRTLVISFTDVLACTENLSIPSDVKGDTLHDVVLSLLQDRADARAELAEWTDARKRFAADRAALDAALAALSRARETDGAVREAAEETDRALRDWLTSHSAGHAGALVKAVRHLLSALSSPPRPETKAPTFTHWTGSATKPPAPPADAATEADINDWCPNCKREDCECASPAPAPSTDPWRACGCADPDNCEHVFSAPAPSAKETR